MNLISQNYDSVSEMHTDGNVQTSVEAENLFNLHLISIWLYLLMHVPGLILTDSSVIPKKVSFQQN